MRNWKIAESTMHVSTTFTWTKLLKYQQQALTRPEKFSGKVFVSLLIFHIPVLTIPWVTEFSCSWLFWRRKTFQRKEEAERETHMWSLAWYYSSLCRCLVYWRIDVFVGSTNTPYASSVAESSSGMEARWILIVRTMGLDVC